jgi:hypothetical protein
VLVSRSALPPRSPKPSHPQTSQLSPSPHPSHVLCRAPCAPGGCQAGPGGSLGAVLVAKKAKTGPCALQYLASGMSPRPGSWPLQVSRVPEISTASSPAGGSGPGGAPHLLLRPPLRVNFAPPCSGSALRGAHGEPEGKRVALGLQRGLRWPQAALPRAQGRAPPTGWEMGRGAFAHPHCCIHVPSSTLVPAPAPGPRSPLTWVCSWSRGGARGYGCTAPRRGAGCSARLRSAPPGAALGPAPPRPSAVAAPPPLPVPRPSAPAAVTQRAGNGCVEGLPRAPLSCGSGARASTPEEPAAQLCGGGGEGKEGGRNRILPFPSPEHHTCCCG